MSSPATGVGTLTHRFFSGLMNTGIGGPTDVDPSTQPNCIGIAYDAGDTEVQFIHNDGSGVCTKIPLGPTFPKPNTDDGALYEVILHSPKGTTQIVNYLVRERLSGAIAFGQVVTNLPATTIVLRAGTWISVGGTSSIIGFTLSLYAYDPLI